VSYERNDSRGCSEARFSSPRRFFTAVSEAPANGIFSNFILCSRMTGGWYRVLSEGKIDCC
jgi:hypothetical protein